MAPTDVTRTSSPSIDDKRAVLPDGASIEGRPDNGVFLNFHKYVLLQMRDAFRRRNMAVSGQHVAPGMRREQMSHTAFISRRFDIHPSAVPGVVAEWHRGLVPVRAGRNSVLVDRRFRLASEPDRRGPDPLRLYAVRGVLWVTARPIRVSLEFSMWSDDVTQVALRPTGLAWPVGTRAYGDRVGAVLDDVIEALGNPVTCHRVIDEVTPVEEAAPALVLAAA